MITLEMIREGFRCGIVKVIDCPDSNEPVCKIGDYWFYFSGHCCVGKTAIQYVVETGVEDVCREIYEALDFFEDFNEFIDEYYYYEAVLIEGLGMKDNIHVYEEAIYVVTWHVLELGYNAKQMNGNELARLYGFSDCTDVGDIKVWELANDGNLIPCKIGTKIEPSLNWLWVENTLTGKVDMYTWPEH